MKSASFLAALSLVTLVVASCSNTETLTSAKSHKKGMKVKGPRRHHKHPKASSTKATTATATPEALAAQAVTPRVSAISSAATSTASSSAAAAPSGTARTDNGLNLPSYGIKTNGIHVGFLPDDGSGGGTSETMAQINSALGLKASTYGYYAQAQSGTPFDGQQLLWRMDDIKAAGGVFQPAVMPTGGWQGLTYADNSQAVNIAKVMQKFVDNGLEVWLRFAHEVNYYQTDGTYTGGVSDFKEGWAVVAAAIKEHAPSVKMWFTPNVADLSQYDQYYPDDPTTVDIIGIDYYPQDTSNLNFLATMQPFHDKYASATTKFAIGETGLGGAADISTRLAWLTDATSPATASGMPHYVALSWFNYQKGYNFKVASTQGDSAVAAYLA